MELFDREAELDALGRALGSATRGEGSVVALLGDAGAGKSSLARAFLEDAAPDVRILQGYCDDLGIAEPLGVLRDLARDAGIDLPPGLFEQGQRLEAFSLTLKRLSEAGRTSVVLVEDVHWADDATLDFLRFLTRRLSALPILLIMTARTDEAQGRQNMRRIMGDAPSTRATRLEVGPLSHDTVARLARTAGHDPETLMATTAGNAFFVTEMLNSTQGPQASTIQDAVLGRIDRLDAGHRAVFEALAIFPRQAEPEALALLVGRNVETALEAGLDMGLLTTDGSAFGFRHVIARNAVLSAVRPGLRKDLNARLLAVLEDLGGVSAARRLHHAREAGQSGACRRLAVDAAREASALGARREAAEYYRVAVETHGGEAPAGLLEDAAYACYLVGIDARAIDYQSRAQRIHSANGDRLRLGDGLRRLSRFHWSAGSFGPARKASEEAVDVLEDLPGPELAMAYSNAAQDLMLNREYHRVRTPAEKAIALAEDLDRADILSHALNNLACAQQCSDPEGARRNMARSLDLALGIGHVDHAARAFVNATYIEMYFCRFDLAKAFALRGTVRISNPSAPIAVRSHQ